MKPERGKGFTKIFIYCFALFLGVEIALYFVSVLSLYFLIPPPPPPPFWGVGDSSTRVPLGKC